MNDLYKDRLKACMDIAGMTASELARQMGVTPQAIGMVLSGNTKALTAANNALAADVLGVDPAYLALGEEAVKLKSNSWGMGAQAAKLARTFDALDSEAQDRVLQIFELVVRQTVSDTRVKEALGLPKTEGE